VHAPIEDKYDDTKDSLYEKLEGVFDLGMWIALIWLRIRTGGGLL
jgi:hypothetical protein